MYDKIKTILTKHRSYCYVLVSVVILACAWYIASWRCTIDTTGIHNAEQQLERAGEYNRQSIEYNQRARTAVERSETNNERIEYAVTRSIEANQRTEEGIATSQELATRARKDAIRAKAIISESRSILERAEERTRQNESQAAE